MAHLLDPSDMSGDVFDGDGIFNGQTMRLAFNTGFVDQHSTIGGKSFIPYYIVSQRVFLEGDWRIAHQRKQGRYDHRARQLFALFVDLVAARPISSPRPGRQRPSPLHRPNESNGEPGQ